MKLLGTLETDFQWGVAFLRDPESEEDPPEFDSVDQAVTSAPAALAIAVRHGDEGPTSVRVFSGSHRPVGTLVHTGEISTSSGRLVLSDVLGLETVEFDVKPGENQISVYFDALVEPLNVEIVVE